MDVFYYTDGTRLKDTSNLPTTGIACIVDYQAKERRIHHRKAYYLDTKQGWIVCDDMDGLIDQVLHNFRNIKRVFQGRGMEHDAFWKLYERVKRENP